MFKRLFDDKMDALQYTQMGLLSQRSQALAAQAAQQTNAAQYKPPVTWSHTVRPGQAKIDQAIHRAIAAIPVRVAVKTLEIRFGPVNVEMSAKRFEVEFTNGHILAFPDIDTFPTDADIARICLEAP